MWKGFRFSDFVLINPLVKLRKGEVYSFVEMKDLSDGQKKCFPNAERILSGGARFENRDTLFARITPCLENGKICQVNGLRDGVGFGSTEFFVFRGRENISDDEFVFYLSRSDEVRGFAEANFDGTSGRQRVPKLCFDNLLLELPSLEEQKSIASVLTCLDDKIDLLHRQNKTLEALAQTLFRQWFVEEAQDSWEEKEIKDVAIVNARSIDGKFPFKEIEYLDTGSITDGEILEMQHFHLSDSPSRAKRIVRKNDIVLSMVRPIQRHYGILKTVKPNTVASTGFVVITCTNIDPHFIYLLLTQTLMTEYLEQIAEGSTSAYPSLRADDVENLEFKMPPQERLNEFSITVSDNFEKIESNKNQIRTLTQLRDTLLPKLMSGEVRIKS